MQGLAKKHRLPLTLAGLNLFHTLSVTMVRGGRAASVPTIAMITIASKMPPIDQFY